MTFMPILPGPAVLREGMAAETSVASNFSLALDSGFGIAEDGHPLLHLSICTHP
jgi:hypothetical protein